MDGDLLPFFIMVMLQFGYAGMNITSKLAMDTGMHPFVFVAYRQISATVAIAPFAYFIERKTRPKMTLSILFEIFLCSIFGVTLNQIAYFVGLKNSTPTIGCAMNNISPALTFIIAVLFRLENVGLKSKAGQAKVLGTIICTIGAFILSFYHGPIVNIVESSLHWKYAEKIGNTTSIDNVDLILGPFLLFLGVLSWSIYLIIQTKMSQKYEAPYTSSALMCVMGSIMCTIISVCFDHNLSTWSFNPPIRILSSVYAGIVCSALTFCAIAWCIKRKGPLYVAVFNPLLLVIVAIFSWAFLQEKLYAGKVLGSVLIVSGLYAVLWGKKREMSSMNYTEEIEKAPQSTFLDLESHSKSRIDTLHTTK